MDSGAVQEGSPFPVRAERLLEQGQFESVRRLAEERLVRVPSDLESKIFLCRALLGMDDLELAVPLIDELESTIQSAARVYRDAGDSFARNGRPGEAAFFYRKYLCLNPEDSDAEGISVRMDSPGDGDGDGPSGPDGLYDRVEEVDSQFRTVTLADLFVRQGHVDMARGVLEEILKRDPNHEEARERLAVLTGGEARIFSSRRNRLAGELARWLQNVDRLKTHGT